MQQDSLSQTVQYREISWAPGFRVGTDGSVWTLWIKRWRGQPKRDWILGDTWKRIEPVKQGKYLSVCLDSVRIQVHQLVLETFVGPCPTGCQACHSPDDYTTNNVLSNLRWDTPNANQADRIAHGIVLRGEANPSAMLSDTEVAEMRKLFSEGWTQAELERKFILVSNATVSRIVRGLTRC